MQTYSPLGPPLPPELLWCEYLQSGAGAVGVGVPLPVVEPPFDPVVFFAGSFLPALCAPSVWPERSTVASFPPQAQRASARDGTATKERRREDFIEPDAEQSSGQA